MASGMYHWCQKVIPKKKEPGYVLHVQNHKQSKILPLNRQVNYSVCLSNSSLSDACSCSKTHSFIEYHCT